MNDFENKNYIDLYNLLESCLNENISVSFSLLLPDSINISKKYILDLKKESRRCSSCIYKEELCINCLDNPIYKNIPRNSKFALYKHTCPYGHKDCVNDPAYIKFFYPDTFYLAYGQHTPEEASKLWCKKRFDKDKNKDMDFYCYSNEDK